MRASHEILAEHVERDGALYERAMSQLNAIREIRPLEAVRWMSVSDLKQGTDSLRTELDAFATARRGQIAGWDERIDPGFNDALAAAGDLAIEAAKVAQHAIGGAGQDALDAAGSGLSWLGRRAQRVVRRDSADKESVMGATRDALRPKGSSDYEG